MNKPRALIMAGGTGGHIFPAQAVATELAAAGWQIHWLGTAKRMEAQLVPKFGWPFHTIDVAGLRGKNIATLLAAPWMLLRSIWQARRLLSALQPDLVIGFGGYASGPGGLAAWLQNVPLLVHEQNAVAGSTNKLLAPLAKRILVAFPAAFAGHAKQVLVGNPVRAGLINCAAGHQAQQGLNVLVVGGSLGAKALNDALPEQFAEAAKAGVIRVIHQSGSQMLPSVQQQYQQLDSPNLQVQVSAFIDDMAQAYRWADVVVCRSGASTVSEVACAGVAAVFVPLPGAIDDHQSANARWLTGQHAATLLTQPQLIAGGILPLLQRWLQHKEELQQMAAKARACALDDATAKVVAICQEVTGQPL